MAAFSVAPVPLVYTQVVHLAIYVFFLISLVSDQFIIWRREGDDEPDILVPFFTMLKFLFIFGENMHDNFFYSSSNTKGWLKTAETMYDPFGEDEEDYNICNLLERHLRSTSEFLDCVILSCRRAGHVYVSSSEDTPEILDAESESAEFINNNDRYQTLMSNIQDIKGSIQSYDIVLCIHFI